jgi:separase
VFLRTDERSLDYVQASVELAQEHVAMGQIMKASAIYSQVVDHVKEGDMKDEVRVRFLLRRAELVAPDDDCAQRHDFTKI